MPGVRGNGSDITYVANKDYDNDPFVHWLQQLWYTERADRSIKHHDDNTDPVQELNNEHMSRVTMYEMGWWDA